MDDVTTEGLKVKARQTKATAKMVRYDIVEGPDRDAVGAIYISKQNLPSPFPIEIEVFIR